MNPQDYKSIDNSSPLAIFAIYHSRTEINVAIDALKKLGFKKSSFWISRANIKGSKDFPYVTKYQVKTGAIFGALLGAAIFGAAFMLGEIAPLANRFLILIAGLFVGGLAGLAAGTLVGIGTPDLAAKRYGQYLQSGGILFSVQNKNLIQWQQARAILLATGGQDIQSKNEDSTWVGAEAEFQKIEAIETENSPHIN
jgi:hypothetical protein